VIDTLFELLAQGWTPWLLSSLIVGAAIAIWTDLRVRHVAPVLRGLDDAIAAVEESEGQGGFRRRFGTVFQRLATNPVIGEVWRGYAATIALAPGQEDALGYTRRPHESFNESLLANAGINLRFYHAVPNLLVGAGLLFTFLGLVAALYFASRGVAAAEVQEAQRALRELLGAATFKFVTSIAGLGSSMLFSWREKALLHRIQRRLFRLCAAFEARMVPLTAESIGIAQLHELRQQQQELQKLGRSLLVKVPDTVEERLTAELVAAVAPLRRGTAAAAERLARIDEWLLDLVLEAAEADGEKAGSRALPVLERLDALVAAVRESRGGLRAGVVPAAPEVAAGGTGPRDLPELLGSSKELMREVDTRLGQSLLRVRDLLGRLGSERKPSRADIESAGRLLLEAQSSLQQAKAASARLSQRLDQLAREGEAMAAGKGGAAEVQAFRQELGTLNQDLRQTLQLLEGGAEAAAERLAGAGNHLRVRSTAG
jgi:hypothetical protein